MLYTKDLCAAVILSACISFDALQLQRLLSVLASVCAEFCNVFFKLSITFCYQDAGDALPMYDKLHNLTLDDKMENALLRSRIDEQSQLIMILKKRADEAIEARKQLEGFNSNLQGCKDDLEDQLRETSKKCEMLDARFFELASNHEEMIKVIFSFILPLFC